MRTKHYLAGLVVTAMLELAIILGILYKTLNEEPITQQDIMYLTIPFIGLLLMSTSIKGQETRNDSPPPIYSGRTTSINGNNKGMNIAREFPALRNNNKVVVQAGIRDLEHLEQRLEIRSRLRELSQPELRNGSTETGETASEQSINEFDVIAKSAPKQLRKSGEGQRIIDSRIMFTTVAPHWDTDYLPPGVVSMSSIAEDNVPTHQQRTHVTSPNPIRVIIRDTYEETRNNGSYDHISNQNGKGITQIIKEIAFMDPIERSILFYIYRQNGKISLRELAGMFTIPPKQAIALLKDLEKRGFITLN